MAEESRPIDTKLERKDITQKKTRDRVKTNSDFVIRKRVPPRLPRRDKDIYITNRSDFQGQLSRCDKLLESGDNEVIIHGLGAAVTRAVNLALQLQVKHHGAVTFEVNTSTVSVVDDLEPQEDHLEYETQTRQNSSVHIRVRRNPLLDASGTTQ